MKLSCPEYTDGTTTYIQVADIPTGALLPQEKEPCERLKAVARNLLTTHCCVWLIPVNRIDIFLQ